MATRYQIGVDGQVGNETWTMADEWLRQVLVEGRIDVHTSSGGYGWFAGGLRIQHFSKTVTGPF